MLRFTWNDLAAFGLPLEPDESLPGVAPLPRIQVLLSWPHLAGLVRPGRHRRGFPIPGRIYRDNSDVTVPPGAAQRSLLHFLAGHSSPTATRAYDRRRRKVTWSIVERISI